MSTTIITHTAPVLAFDAAERERTAAHARLAEHDAAEQAETRALALALGLTEKELEEADEGLYYHAHLIRDIEAAYRTGVAEGRAGVLAVIFETHRLGYDSGLDDAQLEGLA